MAFDIDGFSEVRALGRNRRYLAYDTTDTLSAVLADGYFNAGWYRLGAKDRLDIEASDGRIMATVSAAGAGGVTVASSGDVLAANAVIAGSVARTVAAKLGETVSVKDFGAVGDGVTDDSPAISAAFASGVGNVTFPTPSVSYYLGTPCSIQVSRDLQVDFQQSLIKVVPGTYLKFYRSAAYTLTLSGNIAAGATSFGVSSAAGVSVGDLILLSTTATAESTFGSKANACVVVKSVSGTTIHVTRRIRMPINTADAGLTVSGFTQPGRLRLDNFNGQLVGATATTDPILCLESLYRPVVAHPDLSSDYGWQADGLQRGWGVWLNSCVDANVTLPRLKHLSYGIVSTGGAAVAVDKPTADGCRHPVFVGTWCAGAEIAELTGSNNYGAIDSHAAFDVYYRGGQTDNSQTLPNMRCIGGGIFGHKYHMYGDDTELGPYYHSLALVNNGAGLYSGANLELDGFSIYSPNRAKSVIGGSFGNLRLRNCRANLSDVAFLATLDSVHIHNCRNWDGTPWGRVGVRKAPTVIAQPPVPAVLDTGVYHINPYAALVQQDNGNLRCWGSIARDLSGSPQALTVRIHTNVFPDTDSPTYVLGVIKFRGWVRHGTSGLGDIQGSEFHFVHKAGAATSAIAFPTTAARTDGATGQTNEDLTVVISSPAQSGYSQVGTGGDFYVEIVVTLTSAKTTPIFALTYELELMRMT